MWVGIPHSAFHQDRRDQMTHLMGLRLQAHVVKKTVLEVHEEPGEQGQEERQGHGKMHLLGEEQTMNPMRTKIRLMNPNTEIA